MSDGQGRERSGRGEGKRLTLHVNSVAGREEGKEGKGGGQGREGRRERRREREGGRVCVVMERRMRSERRNRK